MEHLCRVDNTLSELIVNKVVRQKLFVEEKSPTWIYSNGSESDNVNNCFEAGITKLALKLMTT